MKNEIKITGLTGVTKAAKAFGVAAQSIILDVCEYTYRATPWYRPLAKWRAWRDLKRARASATISDLTAFMSSGTVVDELVTKIEYTVDAEECDGSHAQGACPAEKCIRRDTTIAPQLEGTC